MEKLTIDRSRWLRGEGSDASYLLRSSDSKQCCLGFDMLRRGYSTEQISDLTTPVQLHAVMQGLVTKTKIPIQGQKFTYPEFGPTSVCLALMTFNDAGIAPTDDYTDEVYPQNSEVTDLADEADRESRIAAQFALIGIEVEFIG